MKKDFFQELRDRNVWREIKAYLFGGACCWQLQTHYLLTHLVATKIFIFLFLKSRMVSSLLI